MCRPKCPLHCIAWAQITHLPHVHLGALHNQCWVLFPLLTPQWRETGQGQKLQSDSSCDLAFVSTPHREPLTRPGAETLPGGVTSMVTPSVCTGGAHQLLLHPAKHHVAFLHHGNEASFLVLTDQACFCGRRHQQGWNSCKFYLVACNTAGLTLYNYHWGSIFQIIVAQSPLESNLQL